MSRYGDAVKDLEFYISVLRWYASRGYTITDVILALEEQGRLAPNTMQNKPRQPID